MLAHVDLPAQNVIEYHIIDWRCGITTLCWRIPGTPLVF